MTELDQSVNRDKSDSKGPPKRTPSISDKNPERKVSIFHIFLQFNQVPSKR